jgi:methyl-accepting chemotaxis protein
MSGFWTLRRRILFAIVSLLLLTVGSTMGVLYEKMKDAAARGDYLDKHMSRYLSYQDKELAALHIAARSVARDQALLAALQSPEPKAAVIQVRKELGKAIGTILSIDILAVFDPFLVPLSASQYKSVLRESTSLFNPVAEGKSLETMAILSNGKAFLLAAEPVLDAEGKLAGFVVIGRNLERPFSIYSKDSDSNKTKQHQLALVVDGRVQASTVETEQQTDLEAGLEGRYLVPEGKLMATVMDFRDQAWDMHPRPYIVRTYEGKDVQGTMALFRVRQSYEKRVTENLYPVMYVGFGGLIAAIIIAFLLAGMVTRPIRAFTRTLKEITAGEADLTKRLEIHGQDELAGLALAINELNEKVSSLVWQIRDASLRLGQSAQEISHVSMRTLEGAQGQVEKIESSSSLTNELSRTITEIATRANQGAQIAGLGRDSVEKTDRGMTRIKDAVHISWDKVGELKGNVEKIGVIAELISKITEENSMLALNASIEAARAGAAGQGFAVVAQQMREQAKRVEKSSREIIENIGAIQSITQELVGSMDHSKADVDKGSQLVNITLHHLTELSSIMQETAEAVKEQAAASDDIAQITIDVQRIGHEALEASQQTVEEGSRIRVKAQDLATLVGRFKVKELTGGIDTTRQLVPITNDDEEA